MSTERFHETRRFTGVETPRWDGVPAGPKVVSMVACTCGSFWKFHRFVDGACPLSIKDEEKHHRGLRGDPT